MSESSRKPWYKSIDYKILAPLIISLLAAILSAYASFKVSEISAETQVKLGKMSHSMERAKFFHQLTKSLDSEDASYALLTLWNMYNDEEEKKFIVLAALENLKPETVATLLRLDLDEQLVELTVSSVANSSDKSEIIDKLPEDVRFKVFWNESLKDIKRKVSVGDKLEAISLLYNTNSYVRKFIDNHWDVSDLDQKIFIAMILQINQRPELLTTIFSDEDLKQEAFERLEYIIEPSLLEYVSDDVKIVIRDLVIKEINSESSNPWFSIYTLTFLNLDKIPEEEISKLRDSLTRRKNDSESFFLQGVISDIIRDEL